ncbi:uncharacterized protein A4U43_C10F1630 [Asparagus officinalis]|uniref:Bifunctional inhibitor/plant lipid transfer protein/seed storage helical domain-containing protein n=1 Tax=Asparagus officinalis TaxID=4686 RepID=A0A5P1DZY4_ASPOF|nr:lipid transfer-like protein VAS isoform X1 [Asparagus officinalis]XP_020248988.1 lipid transfer-like protein VAS isoform X2 [Asparagus officinalis]XP_020248989.1 lipid transfer-like protein VAS isoform X3 [Asparagus officinalis]ONK55852.1 uncharacterized protein A4U43_C10F1630 [Asparagus officinalis]
MNTAVAIVVLLTAAASLTTTGSAQQVETCASKLVPCGPYINSTSPPESCCGPLKDALTNDLRCLCSIFNSPKILKAFNIDLNSALQLPKRCGMPSFSNNIACVNSTAGAPGHSMVPPATPGDNSNAEHSTNWFGLSGLAAISLFWWSLIA